MPLSIAIVEDHELFREGISDLLSRIPGFNIYGVYENGKIFLEKITEKLPDVILMDIEMPEMDGEATTRAALAKYPQLKIIVLSMHSDFHYYQEMLSAGAKGFILKDTSKIELEKAINEVAEGRNFFSQILLHKIIEQMSFPVQENKGSHYLQILSNRDMQLIELVCKGLSNKDISEQLCISSKAVEYNKTKLFEKLGVKNSIELVIFSLKNRIIVL